MKKFFLFSIVLFASFAQAQTNKAKNLLDEVYNKVISYKNIYIDFRYSLENSKESSLKYDFTQLQMDFFLMESYNFLFIYNDFFEKNAFFYYKYPFWENISSKFLQPPV